MLWPPSAATLVVVLAMPAAYALSHVRVPGRDALLRLLRLLPLLSSVVTGTAARVPAFEPPTRLGLISACSAAGGGDARGRLPAVRLPLPQRDQGMTEVVRDARRPAFRG
ncbi:hypothetical protein [Nonomuraea angiospora]